MTSSTPDMVRQDLEITIATKEELPEAAGKILAFGEEARLFMIDGPMGSGKTTLIKEICRALGSNDHFSSPSYAIVNEYLSPAGKIYHFDLYRVNSPEELLDLGIEEYLASGQYCFFEWPALVTGLVNSPFVKINIRQKENIRYIRAAHAKE